ncbi:MAG: hypothetical protein MUC35_04350 [Candidatus Margulisbacteria bacterium]|jgi:hypothetical protein|nr:hypothetical protein [Candidatus Margulisiibacteriota bacterium]
MSSILDYHKLRDKIFAHRKYAGSKEIIKHSMDADLKATKYILMNIRRFFSEQLNKGDMKKLIDNADGRKLLLFDRAITSLKYTKFNLIKDEPYLYNLILILIIDGLTSNYGRIKKKANKRFIDFFLSNSTPEEKNELLMGYLFQQKIAGTWQYRYICFDKCNKKGIHFDCINDVSCPIRNDHNQINKYYLSLVTEIYNIRCSMAHQGILSVLSSWRRMASFTDAYIGHKYNSDMGLTSVMATIKAKRFVFLIKKIMLRHLLEIKSQ